MTMKDIQAGIDTLECLNTCVTEIKGIQNIQHVELFERVFKSHMTYEACDETNSSFYAELSKAMKDTVLIDEIRQRNIDLE